MKDQQALLLEEQLPQRMDEETFKERLGPAKYRAHLNFVYGIRLEEALQLTVEERNLLSVAYKNVIGARRGSKKTSLLVNSVSPLKMCSRFRPA